MAIRTSYIKCHRTDKTSTLSGNLAVTGTSAFTGNVTLTGDLTIGGSMTFGDASVDTLTVNGTASFNTNATFTLSDAETVTIAGTTTDDALLISAVATDSAIEVSSANAYGLKLSGANTTAAIAITGTNTGRALRIGTKESAATSLTISSGKSVDAEPANNYLFGLFTKVASDESAITDELRSAWIRTRVNEGCHVGQSAGYGYGVCGAEIQLKIYADGAATNLYSWQNSAVWAQLETQGASGVVFKDGSNVQAILANVGMTSTTTINDGAIVSGVLINTNTSTSDVTIDSGGLYYGLFVTDVSPSHLDFTAGVVIDDDVATTGMQIGNCTTGIKLDGTFTDGIRMMGDEAYNPIHIGTKANTATGGLNMNGQDSYDEHGGIMIFGDDGGVALATTYTTSLFWSRYLITANQTSNTATGAYLQMKLKKASGSLDLTTVDYSAAKTYIETDCAVDVKSGGLFVINSTLEMGDDLTNTAGIVAGINVELNDGTNTLTDTAVNSSGILIRKNASSTAGWPVGLNIEASGATTGIKIGTCTTGISIGNAPTGITFTDVGAATEHLIDVVDAYTGMVIETGTYQSSADGGVILSDTNTRPVSFLFDDSAAALTGNNRAVLSRIYLAESQGSGGTIVSIQGQLKIADDKDFSAGRFCGVDGYMEFGGTTDINSGAYVSAINARIDVPASETVEVKTGGYLCGIHIHTTGTGTLTSSGNSYGIYINDQGTVDDWEYGISVNNSATGIEIATCATDGLSFPTGSTYGTSAINMGTFAAPISYATTGKKLVQMYGAYTGTSGSFTGFRMRARGNSASGTASITSALIQADVIASKYAQDCIGLNVETIAKDSATLASGGWFSAGQFKVEDEYATGGSGSAPTFGGHVACLRLMGNISANPTNTYTAIFIDCQSGTGGQEAFDSLIHVQASGQNSAIEHFLTTGDSYATLYTASKWIVNETPDDALGSAAGCLRIDLNGTDYYIPFFDSVT